MDLEKLNLLPMSVLTDKLKSLLIPIQKKSWSNIQDSVSKILADDVIAKIDNPPFDNSAIDGYAIKLENEWQEQTFKILRSISAPGKPFERALKKNEAVRILTGAQIPKGSNKIVFDEEVNVKENKFSFKIKKNESSNIRVKGEDIKRGQLLFKKGYSFLLILFLTQL